MEQLLAYYNFSPFVKDKSRFFDHIAYVSIKDDLYLLFEKKDNLINLHFTSYANPDFIGKQKPSGLNTLIENFEMDNNQHRKIVQQYLDYN